VRRRLGDGHGAPHGRSGPDGGGGPGGAGAVPADSLGVRFSRGTRPPAVHGDPVGPMIQETAHEEGVNVGKLVMHHTADAWTIDLEPITTIHLPRFADIHIGGLTLNLSPTKHVVFMVIAAVLVFL